MCLVCGFHSTSMLRIQQLPRRANILIPLRKPPCTMCNAPKVCCEMWPGYSSVAFEMVCGEMHLLYVLFLGSSCPFVTAAPGFVWNSAENARLAVVAAHVACHGRPMGNRGNPSKPGRTRGVTGAFSGQSSIKLHQLNHLPQNRGSCGSTKPKSR